jgi:uncharacterized membrane protein YidH (DUF202 family)
MKSVISMTQKVYGFLFLVGTSVMVQAADYANIVTGSEEAVKAGGEVIAPWLIVLIARTPFIAILIAVVGVYAYERNKSKEERKDGTFKIIIILVFAAIAVVVVLELVISLIMDYLADDPDLGNTIRQKYWGELLKAGG